MGNQITTSITSDQENMERFPQYIIRDAPPCHFRFKIESFSTLSSSSLNRYESFEFNAGAYKWRLAFYPNGNKVRDGQDHISMYLVLDKTSCKNLDKEISVTFNFLAYDQIRDKYLSVQGVSRFHSMKFESGIDKFIPLKIFNDPSNGYLVEDSCMFGADVFVMESATSIGQCLSMMAVKPVPFKHTWEVEKFSTLKHKCYYSDKFRTGGHDWKISFYPKGNNIGRGNSISLYLKLADEEDILKAGSREVIVKVKLRVVDQVDAKHREVKFCVCFKPKQEEWGSNCYLSLSKLNKSTGYLVNDTCILEAEVIVLGSASNWV